MKTRRLPWEPMAFAKQHCALVVTAVAGVAAAGTAAYGAYNNSQNAKNAQNQIKNNAQALYGSKVDMPKYVDNVNLPNYNPGQGAEDYSHVLPLLSGIASNVNTFDQRQRDKLTGGTSSANISQGGTDINQLEQGAVPKDVQDNVMRMVAQRGAGAFSPTGQTGQQAGMDFARSIGATSTDMMKMGLSYAPQWESMVDAFTYKPQQALGDALSALRERDNYTQNNAAIQIKRDENAYQARVNDARAKAMPDPAVAGAFRDNLVLNQLQNQADMNMLNAGTGMLRSAAGAYAIGTGGSSGGYNNAGYINPAQLGMVSSTYATPGWTPTFGSTPQGAYFTGYI